MTRWSYYEEPTQDGSIPEYALEYDNNEFKRQKREPGYQPHYKVVHNPRIISKQRREKRRDLELEAALIGWSRENAASMQSRLAAPSQRQPNQPQTSQTDHFAARYPSKMLHQSTQAQMDHIRRFPGSYKMSDPRTKSPSQAAGQQRHAWSEVQLQQMTQPKPYPMSSAGSQGGLRTPPVSQPSSATSSPTKQSTQLSMPPASAAPPASRPSRPPTQLATPPPQAPANITLEPIAPLVPPHTGPIPGNIWNVVNEIKACKQFKASGMPCRYELKAARFCQHFSVAGYLRLESELGRYRGDDRLFTPEAWDYLIYGKEVRKSAAIDRAAASQEAAVPQGPAAFQGDAHVKSTESS